MGILGMMSEDSERWRQLLIATHFALFATCLTFTVVAWSAEETCYMVPCYVGTGLETVWKVSKWTVFTSVTAGAFCTGVSMAGFVLFSKYMRDPRAADSHLIIGLFLGVTISAGLAMLDQMGVWSAEWSLMGALSETSHRNEIFYNNGSHLHLRNGLINQFQALTVFAALAAVLQFAIVGQIAIGQGALAALFKIQTGSWAATDAYAPISPEDTDAKGFEV